MRKVTRNAVNAFLARDPRTFSNTTIQTFGNQVVMFLHGNPIARFRRGWDLDGEVNLDWAHTTVTRERLNGLPGVSVCLMDGEVILNGWLAITRDWVPMNSFDDPATLIHESDRKGYAVYEQYRDRPDSEIEIVKRAMGIVQRVWVPSEGIAMLLKPWMENPDGKILYGSKSVPVEEWRELPVILDKALEEVE